MTCMSEGVFFVESFETEFCPHTKSAKISVKPISENERQKRNKDQHNKSTRGTQAGDDYDSNFAMRTTGFAQSKCVKSASGSESEMTRDGRPSHSLLDWESGM